MSAPIDGDRRRLLAAALIAARLLASAPAASAPPTTPVETERLMLSGTGLGDTVEWEFYCTEGRRSGRWTTIAVPSQWEQQGFGRYNYGHDDDKSRERGRYRHRFRLPDDWDGRAVDLVFEGVMTDAEVRLNGRPAGPTHRGGFYRFRYEVTDLLSFGGDNLLEVDVDKHSADASVNRAERDADYWVFGGIYRPVYLEAAPRESIARLAIDARHDGELVVQVFARGLAAPARLTARVETLDGHGVGAGFSAVAHRGREPVILSARIGQPLAWSAEHPHLYRLVVEMDRSGQLLHRVRQRFGFRTVEVRPGAGLYVNGRRTLLKGVNRHAFWPPSGRTLNRDLDLRDAELIKAMNMNAVRTSHYPPDATFLEACDRLGLYVIDELAGWHDAYATAVGRGLVREMVARDVNHPSVIFWANGNEGGWNPALDGAFAEHDVQRRPVLHPHAVKSGIDAEHYLTWDELSSSLDPASLGNRWRRLFAPLPLVMPTELLHGLYDGGSGAGLEDYWHRLRSSPRAAGAFLWSFTDEAVVRTDRGGLLDTDGNHAPDGVLGPYRELSGNFYAVRETFSPIRIDEAIEDGVITIDNRFAATDLADCRFVWRLLDFPAPGERRPGGGAQVAILDRGELRGPAVAPGGRGRLRLPLPPDWRRASALGLAAHDPHGREVWAWVLPIHRRRLSETLTGTGRSWPGGPRVAARVVGDRLILAAATGGAQIDLRSGELEALIGDGRRLTTVRGPLRADGAAAPASAVRHYPQGLAQVVEVAYASGLAAARWTLYPSGWLRLSYRYTSDGSEDFHGIRFEIPDSRVRRIRWLGDGPERVWKNRLRGGTLGVWEKDLTIGASSQSSPFGGTHGPEGFYSGLRWAELTTDDGVLLIAAESDDLYLGLFSLSRSSSTFPDDARHAVAKVPAAGISLLSAISAIGTKFHPSRDLGPQSRRGGAAGLYRGAVWLRFRPRPATGRATPEIPDSTRWAGGG